MPPMRRSPSSCFRDMVGIGLEIIASFVLEVPSAILIDFLILGVNQLSMNWLFAWSDTLKDRMNGKLREELLWNLSVDIIEGEKES